MNWRGRNSAMGVIKPVAVKFVEIRYRLSDIYTAFSPLNQFRGLVLLLNLILWWMNNHIDHNVCGEFVYLCKNVNGTTVKILEWINIFITYITQHVITYPYHGVL